jgi:peptidoglycan/LPS O-acetylase OafA/YrhL
MGFVTTKSGENLDAHGASRQITRRYELDWLRAGAVFGLIPFHAIVVFTTASGDYVKNAETSYGMDFLISLIAPWGMPLIFLVGGASAYFALQSRSPRAYITERLSRLLIPFLFGMLVIVPIQVYIGQVQRLGAPPPFVPFYAQHVARLLRMPVEGFPPTGTDWIGHLWFIPILIVFALLAMPLARLLQHVAPAQSSSWTTQHRAPLALLFLVGLSVGALQFILLASASQTPTLQPLASWALFVTFLCFFLAGYLIYRLPPLTYSIRTVAMAALALALVSLTFMEIVDRTHHVPATAFTFAFAAYCVLRGYVSWFWVIGLLGFGMRYFAHSPRWLPYMTEATYPAYIIHMPILSFIALFVVGWPMPLILKCAVIAISTCVVALSLYDVAIKRIPLLRFLFGLKPLRARTVSNNPASPPASKTAPSSASSASRATAQTRRLERPAQFLLTFHTRTALSDQVTHE